MEQVLCTLPWPLYAAGKTVVRSFLSAAAAPITVAVELVWEELAC